MSGVNIRVYSMFTTECMQCMLVDNACEMPAVYVKVYSLFSVIAWGLSLERPTMIKYKIENIRDLFGHKADLAKQRTAPIARF